MIGADRHMIGVGDNMIGAAGRITPAILASLSSFNRRKSPA
jgi:hypothetical protein